MHEQEPKKGFIDPERVFRMNQASVFLEDFLRMHTTEHDRIFSIMNSVLLSLKSQQVMVSPEKMIELIWRAKILFQKLDRNPLLTWHDDANAKMDLIETLADLGVKKY